MANDNIYGVQRIPEDTSNNSPLQSAINGVTGGASLGANFGPYGQLAGGIGGAAIGYMKGKDAQGFTDLRNRDANNYNAFASKMENQITERGQYQPIQAENGSGGGKVVEVEGGKYGEILMNSKYEYLGNTKGSPDHDDNQFPKRKEALKEGEFVIPTQNDKAKHDKVMTELNKYAMNGNPASKRYLDNEMLKAAKAGENAEKAKDGNGMLDAEQQRLAAQQQAYDARATASKQQNAVDSEVPFYLTQPELPTIEQNIGKYDTKGKSKSLTVDVPLADPTSTQTSTEVSTDTSTDPVDPVAPETIIEDRTNYGKYASVVNNFMQGMKAPERSERRTVAAEDMPFKDRSAGDLREINREANARRLGGRGKGLSAGQSQAYQGSISSGATDAKAKIAGREAQRYDMVQAQNMQARNQANQLNFQAANQYDIQDAQNRAATQRYTDQAMSDVAQLSQIGEQKEYMKAKDLAEFDMDKYRTKMAGSKHYGYDPYNLDKAKYIKPEDGK